jgi:hypothetical protein
MAVMVVIPEGRERRERGGKQEAEAEYRGGFRVVHG